MCLGIRQTKNEINGVLTDVGFLEGYKRDIERYADLSFVEHSGNCGIYLRSINSNHGRALTLLEAQGYRGDWRPNFGPNSRDTKQDFDDFAKEIDRYLPGLRSRAGDLRTALWVLYGLLLLWGALSYGILAVLRAFTSIDTKIAILWQNNWLRQHINRDPGESYFQILLVVFSIALGIVATLLQKALSSRKKRR